jgi:mRNA-degrading endonuclease toxin of MazEF toxin-antitoxin module
MEKDFAGWSVVKARLDSLESLQYFREREVWWVAIGHNVGSEECGKGAKFARPVLVLRKLSRFGFYGVSLSSKRKIGRYRIPVRVGEIDGDVLLDHVRELDVRRLLIKISSLGETEHREIVRAYMEVVWEPYLKS